MRVSIASFMLVVGCFVPAAIADVTYNSEQVGEFEIPVVRMTVTPAAEPVPALRFRLMPRDLDLKSGNRATYYYRAQLDLRGTMKTLRDKFDEDTQLSPWLTAGEGSIPIAKLPLQQVRQVSQTFDAMYESNLKPAFERRNCDWQFDVEDLRGIGIVAIGLDEFQNGRQIARLISLKTRLAIAERRYDDAIEMMQHQYRLGSDVARVPLLVCGLIGIAIDNITNSTVIELIANPDSPDLYWAIAELPQPPINLRTSARFELDLGLRTFPFMNHAETTEHAPQEWNRLFTQTVLDFSKIGGNVWGGGNNGKELGASEAGVVATGLALLGYSHAREQLIAQGMERERVEKMAVGQVIAIYSERVYRQYADEFETLWYLPFAEMGNRERSITKTRDEMSVLGTGKDREILPIASLLLPAMQAARGAQMRLERDIAALRVIEALRMYAADHNRQLPKSLDEITAVPVPLNPATGKPFAYRLDGKTAVLELPPSDHVPGSYRRYEIQIAEK